MVRRPFQVIATVAGLCALLMAGCASTNQIVLSPSLAPVDLSKPMVRYQPIQGTSCTSALDALWDMKRLVGVDGYVEVTLEQGSCWTATAYPFTYGKKPKAIQVRNRSARPPAAKGSMTPAPAVAAVAPAAAPAPAPAPARATSRRATRSRASTRKAPPSRPAPAAAPAPPAKPAPTRATCTPACKAFGKHAGATAFIQGVVTDRCIARCSSGDTKYYECIQRVRDVSGVQRCNNR